MAAETCPAALPMCVYGHRGCTEHETWIPVEPNWRKTRIKTPIKRRKHR